MNYTVKTGRLRKHRYAVIFDEGLLLDKVPVVPYESANDNPGINNETENITLFEHPN